MECEAFAGFSYNQSLESWNMNMKDWLFKYEKNGEYDGLGTARVVFNSEGRVLLIQRASHDSMPDRWELPDGAVDEDDATILHAAARELREESGLHARRFTHVITKSPHEEPGRAFRNRAGTKVWCQFTFVVEVYKPEPVALDPAEHQDFLWASKEVVRDQRTKNREITITHGDVRDFILAAFSARKNPQQMATI